MNNDDNNVLGLQSAQYIYDVSKRFTEILIITPVIRFRMTRTQCVHILLLRGLFHPGVQNAESTKNDFPIVSDTHITPGW